MADFTITIPDIQIPRIKEAYKARMLDTDAVDPENPTNAELRDFVTELYKNMIKKDVLAFETNQHQTSFVYNDLNITS